MLLIQMKRLNRACTFVIGTFTAIGILMLGGSAYVITSLIVNSNDSRETLQPYRPARNDGSSTGNRVFVQRQRPTQNAAPAEGLR